MLGLDLFLFRHDSKPLIDLSLKRSISRQLTVVKQLKAGSFSQHFVSRLADSHNYADFRVFPDLGRTTDPTHIELCEFNASKAPSAETWSYRCELGDIFVSQTLTERRTTRRPWYAATLVLLWKVARLGINVFFFLSQSPLPSDSCLHTLLLFSSCLFVVLSHRSHTRRYDYLDITSTNSRGLVQMSSKSAIPVPIRPSSPVFW
jgi:hypothetical protein